MNAANYYQRILDDPAYLQERLSSLRYASRFIGWLAIIQVPLQLLIIAHAWSSAGNLSGRFGAAVACLAAPICTYYLLRNQLLVHEVIQRARELKV